MSNDTHKAESLRTLADMINNGIPGLEYHSLPMNTYLFFRTENDRQNAIDTFKRAGHKIRTETGDLIEAHIGGDKFTAGITVSLIVPSLENE
ncbi:hypothetical protein [Glutamicibacter creatinolyticus]|uniref:hypothetical protein n=1 Tax=Glutamicibacter creatinolyticus TaxID=162496 RepID=UPI003217082D